MGVTHGRGVLAVALATACSSKTSTTSSPHDEPRSSTAACDGYVAAAAGTKVHGFTIPTAHPRLWWTSERLGRARAWLDRHPLAPIEGRLEPDDILQIALLHAVTGASCQSAIDWVTSYKIRDDAFAVASDEVRWHGEYASLVFDWCHDQLDGDRRAALIKRWNGYLTKSMNSAWGGTAMPSNNYFWGYVRNQLDWGIATYGENAAADGFLDNALDTRWRDTFVPFAAGKDGAGGVPQEGTQYGEYMLTYPIISFDTIGMHGRSLYEETEFFKGSVMWLIYATTPAATTSTRGTTDPEYEVFPFNDDQKWNDHGTTKRFTDFMATAAMRWSCKPIGEYARTWLERVGAPSSPFIAAVDRGSPKRELAGLPLDYYAPGGGHFFGRGAWSPSTTAFHWQFSHAVGVGHSHHDFGTWQLWRNGRWLSRESVGYSDVFTGFDGHGVTNSDETAAHNALLVNGKGFAASSDGLPVVRRMESGPEYAYAAVDLSAVFHNDDRGHPERDNPAVVHVEREFVFVRRLETTVIIDRIESTDASHPKTFLAHFEQPPTVEAPNRVAYISGTQALRISVLVPSAPTIKVINEQTPKGTVGQFRLEVTTTGDRASYFVTVLQAADAAAAPLAPKVVEDATSFTITLDATTVLTFAKGMVSAGGSIAIKGTTHPLRADVQPVALTDAGPVWR